MPFAFLRALWGVVISSFIGGVSWSLGASATDTFLARYGKGIKSMLGKIDLLFHPSVTRIAVFCSALSNLSGLAIALGSQTSAIKGVFGDRGPQVAGALILFGVLCAQIAGWGRSTVPAVDNNQKPA